VSRSVDAARPAAGRGGACSSDPGPIRAVPTNVITGFLGVGKTTAILSLIARKPAKERWAVLVNEFGEIGVDGHLFAGRASEADGVFVEEVPGGCMCCASSLPMQIALNRLLRRAHPHRLLIEPTGLGHPAEVLRTLARDHNRETLEAGRTLTLVDARNLSDPRYTSHATFLQQLEIADVVIGNKADLYGPDERHALAAFVAGRCHEHTEVLVTERGQLDPACLEGAPLRSYGSDGHHHAEAPPVLAADLPFPASGVVAVANTGEGFHSVGWRFSPLKVFDRNRLLAFLSGLEVERLKAVFITDLGVFGYNLTRDTLDEIELDDCAESRIEIIAEHNDPQWESELFACLQPPSVTTA